MASKTEAGRVSGRRGRPSLQEAAEKRRSIVRAAMELFLRSGYKEVSIRQIAELADVSTRTVFNMFEDKEGLLRACLQTVAQDTGQPILIEQVTVVETLETFASNMLRTLSRPEGLGFAQLVMRNGRDMPELAFAGHASQDQQFVQPLATYLRGHLARPAEAETLAKIYISMAITEWNRSITFLQPLPDEQQCAHHAAYVARIFARAIDAS